MKVVFLGNFIAPHSSESHHAASLEALGHEVIRLQENDIKAPQLWSIARKADLFVWVHTHDWHIPRMDAALREIRRCKVPIVTYHLDLYYGIPSRFAKYENDPYFNQLDHFFTADGPMADWLNANTTTKGHYLPPGVFHEDVYYRPQEVTHDVIFVGSYHYHPEWPYRPKLIDWLRDTYEDRFTLYGADRAVRGDELNRLYASAKVVVGDTFCPDFTYGPYYSDRVPETLGRGGMLVMPRAPGIFEEDYVWGEHLGVYEYNDFDLLKAEIDFYLHEDEQREKVRRVGQQHVAENHTYLNRWDHILKTIGATHG